MKKIEHMKRYMKRSFLLLPALLLACALTASAEEVLPGTNYGKIAIGANEVTMNGSYIGATGAELYLPVTANNNTTGHGLLAIAGTATGSTKIVLNNFSATWDGTSIDLVEATAAGSAVNAFTMDATTAATSGKKAVLRSRVDGEKRTWFITTGAELDLTVFLQGAMNSEGAMNNYIQTADENYSYFDSPQLPETDPYGVGVNYPGINSNAETFPVVDWLKVEIWRIDDWNTNQRTVLEQKALLLQPDGTALDIDGQRALFNVQEGEVRIVVKHRNHLGIMSKAVSDFSGKVPCNFDTEGQAVRMSETEVAPMVKLGNHWCMWAGDVNSDGYFDASDYGLFLADYLSWRTGEYMNTDFNMDGYIDTLDDAMILSGVINRFNSILYYFE